MTIDLKDRLYTSSEVAEILGVSLRSVYRYLEEGKLDADIKTATGRHRFSRKNILDFLQPGGITKESAEETFLNKNTQESDEFDDIDVLDLPAINKVKKNTDLEEDFDFDLDLDEDFFKTLNFDSSNNDAPKENNLSENNKGMKDGEYFDDDLEKLLREFEEKESSNSSSDSKDNLDFSKAPANNSKLENNDDFDLDLDDFFKELEQDSSLSINPESTKKEYNKSISETNSKKDDFDFDLDFLDEFFEKEEESYAKKINENKEPVISKEENNQTSNHNSYTDSVEDSEDNWLERFRKAAQKNNISENKVEEKSHDTLKSSFFDKSNLDYFFSDSGVGVAKDAVSSLSFDNSKVNTKNETNYTKSQEYYYVSSLNGLKEIAQNVDKIARKFDTDYAFTMNAGLSLHKPISPFTLIHVYVRKRDLELFEDYLNLSPVDSGSEASICLIVPEDTSVFEDAYELHGLYVVSNVQLRSDLIDKGLDKLAREI